MTIKDKRELYDLLDDLMCDYVDKNSIPFDDNEKWENDEIILSIDTLKEYLGGKL